MYMGAMWTWLRHKYNSILPGMFSHFVYNGTLIGITMLALKLQSVFGDSGIGVE
jgi:membrane protease YdiL (CAAX protease family)